ncbi:hypothetical protein Z517_01760 [Fonsecaea pedrosoi CBS 271.37]|uniref:Fumarylacetoacetase-like C-terminal domain-containing protein n=1 Tax=Fonsecaea pedrosoi CBS 271.37 TaxID=1442368 RepID=A0A0D2HPH7_9EURO|nr:uncharacterized protein Z517_01760 [Fonsecaea pedrosoi CBS 271.37]KIW86364.1 hypothetical protein Z517_01760 [Fonsecaea pedrosoi CBS 271.37]
MADFGKLIRFKDAYGDIYHGEAEGLPAITKSGLIGSSVPVYSGESPWDPDFKLLPETRTIAEVLPPLADIPVIYCIGMNYKSHAGEAGAHVCRVVLIELILRSGARAAAFDTISVHPECIELDYEVELTVVIGKDCKNITEDEDPFDYVLGYTVGNDVSSRYWQNAARGNGQPAVAKSFDKFAPLGPVISSKRIIPDPTQLRVKTRVNGEERQNATTDDWIFDLPLVLRHITRGTTVRKGSVIMTGTPSGVAFFMKPQAWLKDGDVLETEIQNIGVMENAISYEREPGKRLQSL